MAVKPIPDGYHSVTPYMAIKGAAAALEFYKKAFGAEEIMRMPGPNGGVAHAEMRIGNSLMMLADEFPDMNHLGPTTRGGTTVSLMIYVPNVDQVFQAAVAAGATVLRPLENQFYGDRSGTITDPFGHVWTISTHVEDVPPDEMEKRAAAAFGQK